MERATLLLGLALTACAAPQPARRSSPAPTPTAIKAPAPESTWSALEARIRERSAREEGTVAVSLIDLESGRRLAVLDTVSMHAASTMKVPVMLELFRRGAGAASLEREIRVRNQFTSIADGSRYSLSATDDAETELYERVGTALSMRELARRMIVRSSNLATNLLIEEVTADSVMATMRRIGAPGMRVLRGVEDVPAYDRGMNNTTTAAALARVLESIARCEGASRAACDAMIEILAAQEFNEMIPAGMPTGTRVAHKTGWITGIRHDGAIVYPPGRAPYVLVVMTRGIADTEVAARVAADVSREVWRTLVEAPRAALPVDGPARERLALYDRFHVPALLERRYTHRELWDVLDPIVGGGDRLTMEEVGRSVHGRPLRLVRFGTGPTRVLLWSQMHGDESTATRALVDLMNLFAHAPDDPRVRRIGERLSVYMLPMLNPDGAERFQRRNAMGIDVNRDALALSTPEGRALKAVRDRLRPDFGFNLHDQDIRTRVGESDRLAAFSLLAPAFDEAKSMNPVRERATHVAAVVRDAVEPLLAGRITRYDDGFNPRAFGDNMQLWGTSTVLIESGGLAGDPEKNRLRRANFVGILAALEAIADGSYAEANPARYTALPENGRRVNDLLILGGRIVLPGAEPYRADVAVDITHSGSAPRASIADVGDLGHLMARDTVDATGLFVHTEAGRNPAYFGDGGVAVVWIRRGPDPSSEAVWVVRDGAARRVSGTGN